MAIENREIYVCMQCKKQVEVMRLARHAIFIHGSDFYVKEGKGYVCKFCDSKILLSWTAKHFLAKHFEELYEKKVLKPEIKQLDDF